MKTRTERNRHILLVLSLLIPLFADARGRARQGSNDQQLIGALQSGTYEQRFAAVQTIQRIPPNERTTALLTAISLEVDRYWLATEQMAADRAAGKTVEPPADHGQYLFELVKALSQVENPIVLPALIKSIGTGNRPMDAIVGFGELAVARVVTVARGEEYDNFDNSAAVTVLARMLERPVRHPLSAESKQMMIEVARERLSGQQRSLLTAIDLAVATGDPALIQKVRALAQSDRPAAATFEISDPNMAATARKRAADVLAAHGIR